MAVLKPSYSVLVVPYVMNDHRGMKLFGDYTNGLNDPKMIKKKSINECQGKKWFSCIRKI